MNSDSFNEEVDKRMEILKGGEKHSEDYKGCEIRKWKDPSTKLECLRVYRDQIKLGDDFKDAGEAKKLIDELVK